jgi:ribonucleoside-diphosphate reductase alpha chain
VKVLVDKFSHTRFEPSGFTNNTEIPIAKSITDYIFRWLALKFLPADERPNGGEHEENGFHHGGNGTGLASTSADLEAREHAVFAAQADAPPCHECGEIMVRSGACYACRNCGATSGCS